MRAVSAAIKVRRFVTSATAQVELAPWGKHWWLSRPGLTDTKHLTLVRVRMRPGAGHRFHYHPMREEIIYVLDGVAEQWVGKEKRRLKAGEIAFIPKNVVHAIHNSSKRPMSFLAILSPARAKGPFLVDCYEDEPWRTLRKEKVQRRFRNGSERVQKGFKVQTCSRFKTRVQGSEKSSSRFPKERP